MYICTCVVYYMHMCMYIICTRVCILYAHVHSDCVNIISRHLDYMVRNEIEVQEQNEQLPSFYWLPKLHKKPYGSRFIAASNKCTTKRLSSLLTSCFKTIITHYKQYCAGIYNHSGINCFGIINNSTEVLDRLHKLIRPQELNNLIVTILLHYIRISHTMP